MEKTLAMLLKAAEERGLPCLLIGGNAVIVLGSMRVTVDIDLLVSDGMRSRWLDFMRDLGFRFLHGTAAFAQFEPGPEAQAPVDLMFVDAPTWERFESDARAELLSGVPVRVPRPEHLVALKLHAASSLTRSSRVQDWEDIRQIVRTCRLDPADAYFRAIILRYGGEDALAKIVGYQHES